MTSEAEGPNLRQTLTSSIYLQLRREILTGALAPRAKLNIRELCERFSVGLSPVREALTKLSAEQLVQQADNRGFSVMPVSLAEFVDLTEARCWINEAGLRHAIARGGAEWEEAVVLAFHRLTRTPRHVDNGRDSNLAWEQAHRVFHRSLIAGCGSHWLIDTCDRLFDASERYRHLARLAGAARPNLQEEHRAIMQATIDRKVEEAVDLLSAHFRHTADLVAAVVGDERPRAGGRNGSTRPSARRPAVRAGLRLP